MVLQGKDKEQRKAIIRENQARVLLHKFGGVYDPSFKNSIYAGLEVRVNKKLEPGVLDIINKKLENHNHLYNIFSDIATQHDGKHEEIAELSDIHTQTNKEYEPKPLGNQLSYLQSEFNLIEKPAQFRGLHISVKPEKGVAVAFEHMLKAYALSHITKPVESQDAVNKLTKYEKKYQHAMGDWIESYDTVAQYVQLQPTSPSSVIQSARVIGITNYEDIRNKNAPAMLYHFSHPSEDVKETDVLLYTEARNNILALLIMHKLIDKKHITSISSEDVLSMKIKNYSLLEKIGAFDPMRDEMIKELTEFHKNYKE